MMHAHSMAKPKALFCSETRLMRPAFGFRWRWARNSTRCMPTISICNPADGVYAVEFPRIIPMQGKHTALHRFGGRTVQVFPLSAQVLALSF